MELIPEGVVLAKAQWWDLGETGGGKEQVAITFTITSPSEYLGRTLTYYGFFTEKTLERTVEAMRLCGWQGNDLENLTGLDANEVQLVVRHEEYEGKVNARVAFVNAVGGGAALKKTLDPSKKREFAQRMRGAIAAIGQGTRPPSQQQQRSPQRGGPPEPPPHSDADMPF